MQVKSRKLTLAEAQKALPTRLKTDNKSSGGKSLIVAGSKNMWGAAVLCATAAARIGAGYVYIYDPKGKFSTAAHPDFLLKDNLSELIKFSSIALGPGFSNQLKLLQIIFKLQSLEFPSVVLDAEAINVLSSCKLIPQLPATWIVTPHEGELARLLNVSSLQIKKDRIKYVLKAQKKLGCSVVLKGHKTLIATPTSLWENPTGNSSLAKAGTGDVLTGIIAGFLCQKMNPEMAAVLGCYIHGRVADVWIEEENDPLSLLASDLIAGLPKILNAVRRETISKRRKK